MANQVIKIPRANDRSIIKLFKTLNEFHNTNPFSITTLGNITLNSLDYTTADKNETLSIISRKNSQLIDSCTTSIKSISIRYHRGGLLPAEHKSAIFDEVVIASTSNQTPPSPTEIIEIIFEINKQLKPFDINREISSAKTEAESQLNAIHHSTLERLERLNEELIEKGSEFRASLEKRYEEKLEALSNEIEEKKNSLEADFEKKYSDLENREQSLAERLSKVDDRDNTHARREIRDNMLSDVKQRVSNFSLSRSTEKKRTPVLAGIILLITAMAVLLALSIIEIGTLHKQELTRLNSINNISLEDSNLLSQETAAKIALVEIDRTATYWLWIRISLLTFGFAASVIFYIKWQNKWAEQHAANELQLQQFYIDVNRANWVIESCLEWTKETEVGIPSEIISSMTRNLFRNQQQEQEQVIHPADELASALMGSASRLRLKLGEHELDFNKPSNISKSSIVSKSPLEGG